MNRAQLPSLLLNGAIHTKITVNTVFGL